MLLESWIRNICQSLVFGAKTKSRRQRLRHAVESLEIRLMPSSVSIPTVTSINVVGSTDNNQTTEAWTATFSQSVTGVAPTDFVLVPSGNVGATLTQVSGSGSVYTITASGITGNGTLGLNLVDNDSIMNSSGTPLGGAGANNGNFTGQVAAQDHVFPSVVSINESVPANDPTSASSVSFTATFSEAVSGVNAADFSVVATGTVASTSIQVSSVSSSVYTVTVSGITGLGTVGVMLVDNGQIRDLAGNPLSPPSATASFANQSVISTGTGPRTVVAADVNGDGVPDLIVPNLFDSDVSVFLGKGDGTFPSQRVFGTGTRPYSVAVGDVNGDGKADIVVTNSSNASVGVLLGNGDGTFQTMVTYAVGTQPRSVAIADQNGDGKQDIITSNYFDGTVSVLLGKGDGTFNAQQTFGVQGEPTSVVVADVNGDGKPDIAVANLTSNSVSLLLGNGDGTFQFQRIITVGTNPISVAISDVNGDGKPDLAVSNYNGSSIGILLGNGDGTFQTMQTTATSGHAFGVKLADLNGDGKPDLITNYRQTNQVGVLLGNGNGTFQSAQYFSTGNQPYAVAVADLNGDGRPDLAVASFSGSPGVSGWTASVLLGNANGGFRGQSYTIVAGPTVIAPTVTATGTTTVKFGANVTSAGFSPVTESGIVYSLTSVNANPQIGGTGVTQLTASSLLGLFSINASGLTNQGIYSFAAYASSSVGTTYTPVTTFTVDLPPAVLNIESAALAYKANDPAFPPLPISNTVAITDPDSNNLTKVTVQITSGYENDSNGKDVLAFSNKYGIAGSFDAASGTLTLSGTAYVGWYREALRTVTFSSSGTNVSSANRTLTILASDDSVPSPAVSQPVTRTITVLTTNVPPTLAGIPGTPLSYVQGTAPVAVAPLATITDPDSFNMASATVQVSGNYQKGLDLLTAVTTGTAIAQSFDANSGTLTLSGIDSLPNYQAVLRTMTFGTSSMVGSTALRTLTFLVNDGIANSAAVTSSINVIPFNFPPVIRGIESTPLAYKANDPAFPPLPISNSVFITDPDSNNLSMVTVQITSGYQNDSNGQDTLAFTSKYGITGSFNAATGTLTLTGTVYAGYYREVLRSVTFSSAGLAVSTANRILTMIATDDGSPNAGVSQPVTRTVTVSNTNVPPTLTGVPSSPLSYVQGATPIVVATGATIVDPDSINMGGATVQITANYQSGNDVLTAVTTGTAITQLFNSATGTLSLSGIDTLNNYQTVLQSIRYSTSSRTGSTATRTLTMIVNDGVANSVKVTRDVNVIAFNFPPVISGMESTPLAYKANDPGTPPQPISNTVAITDPDSNNLTKITIQITSGYQNDANGSDVLAFTSKYGINGTFDSSSGTLTLSGTAYVGYYREALRSVTFSSSGADVSTANRVLTIIATDDGSPTVATSQPVTRSVSVSLANYPPTLSGISATAIQYVRGSAAAVVAQGATVTDPDNTTMNSATIQVSVNYQNGQDVLSAVTTGTGITAVFNAASGTLTLSGVDTIANYDAVLNTVSYKTNSASASSSTRTLTFIVNDGHANSSTVVRSILLS